MGRAKERTGKTHYCSILGAVEGDFKSGRVQESACNVQRGVRLIAMCVRSSQLRGRAQGPRRTYNADQASHRRASNQGMQSPANYLDWNEWTVDCLLLAQACRRATPNTR